MSIATEKFSNGFTLSETLLRVALAAVEVDDVAAFSVLAVAALPAFDEALALFGSLFVPPDIPAIRDPSLAVPSENGNFPPRGDLRLNKA